MVSCCLNFIGPNKIMVRLNINLEFCIVFFVWVQILGLEKCVWESVTLSRLM